MQDRGFAYDDKADSVLGDYIAQGWCFTAMRINPNASVTESLLKQGAINPLRFTFKSDKLVYPLHISSLNPGPSEVLLYVLADKAYEHRTATLEFADSWQGNQVKVLEQFSDVAGQLEKAGGCFLTKLRGTYQPEDMKDLYLVPAGKESLQLWPASLINHQSTTGSHLPLWALVLMLLVTAALAALFLQRALPALFGSPARMLIVLLVLFIAMSGILVPLTLNSREGNQEAAQVTEANWPWQKNILISENGWKKSLHPDGEITIEGLDSQTENILKPLQYTSYTTSERPGSVMERPLKELDAAGTWTWGIEFYPSPTEPLQTRYLVLEKPSEGMKLKTDIGMKEVHDARLSASGDTLWIAVNPGVPVNKTEVQEYSLPSLELRRSILHDYCMETGAGKFVLDQEGRLMLAGRFIKDNTDIDAYFGLLPALDANAEFAGVPLTLKYEDRTPGNMDERIGLLNNYFCDALDNSTFLLLRGEDFASGTSRVYVVNAHDGSLYNVASGNPISWQ